MKLSENSNLSKGEVLGIILLVFGFTCYISVITTIFLIK